jgi:hypothetical protein
VGHQQIAVTNCGKRLRKNVAAGNCNKEEIVRSKPFHRILAIYAVALLLPLWFVARQPIARSAKNVMGRLRCALEIKHAYAALVDDSDSTFPVQDHEVIQKSFSLAGAAHKAIEIDNIFGSIEVVGGPSDQVQLVVDKATRAESKDALALSHKEVTLDITQPDGGLKLYVNGPFRCQCEDSCRSSRRRDDEGYIVKMDFVLHVPSNVDVKVKTVNEGRVIVRNVTGNFIARNVNGDIELDSMAGSGIAHTVNGPVKVSFRENPKENSSFQSVNGNIDLLFARGLSADFRFKTFNGGIYSDFPVTTMPVRPVTEERHAGKVVYRSDRFTAARVSAGGPEIKIENLNGDIRILENHE